MAEERSVIQPKPVRLEAAARALLADIDDCRSATTSVTKLRTALEALVWARSVSSTIPGVTGNAQILAGYIAGSLHPRSPYEILGVDPAAGTIQLQHTVTEITFLVSIIQLEGIQ